MVFGDSGAGEICGFMGLGEIRRMRNFEFEQLKWFEGIWEF